MVTTASRGAFATRAAPASKAAERRSLDHDRASGAPAV